MLSLCSKFLFYLFINFFVQSFLFKLVSYHRNFHLRASPENTFSSLFSRLLTLLAHILCRKFLFWCLLCLEKSASRALPHCLSWFRSVNSSSCHRFGWCSNDRLGGRTMCLQTAIFSTIGNQACVGQCGSTPPLFSSVPPMILKGGKA